MIANRLVAKFVVAVAIGASTGGVVAYSAEHIVTERVPANAQLGTAPAHDDSTQFAAWFKPAADNLR